MIKEAYQPETAQDIQEALKDLASRLIEEMLKAELDNYLDYDYGNKPLGLNTRNGYSTKIVKSSGGEMDIKEKRKL